MKTKLKTRLRVAPGFLLGVITLAFVGCQRETPTRWQGYLEGEFIYVASSLPGRLERLNVQRGDLVKTGMPLFQLDQTVERATLRETQERLNQTESRLADLRKGQRPSELDALAAKLDQARSLRELSKLETARLTRLFEDSVVSAELYDRARFAFQRDDAQVRELEAQLATAKLGARVDTIRAAEAEVAVARTAVARAEWSLTEKAPVAQESALVYDTFYRPGETAMAGKPVISLLPPANLKVRFFVSESARATLAVGDVVQVSFTGELAPTPAKIVYLSPQAEFTPPVLYNRENRAKLVYMIEAVFAADAGVELRPGQPVDVARAD